MRRIPIAIGSAAAVLTATGLLAVNGGAQQPTGRTIELVSKNGQFKFVDVPPKASSPDDARPGDQFVISAVLTDRAGKRAGRFDAQCTMTRGGRNLSGICDGAYALADGVMFLAARLTPADDVTGAVVGGTGAYAGARGTFTSKDRPGEAGGDPSDETINLLP
jgi:hypothetical protein